MHSWNYVPIKSLDAKIIVGIWKFRGKVEGNGTFDKYKAIFCACGYQQEFGRDFMDNTAYTMNMTTLCMLSLVAGNILTRRLVDVYWCTPELGSRR